MSWWSQSALFKALLHFVWGRNDGRKRPGGGRSRTLFGRTGPRSCALFVDFRPSVAWDGFRTRPGTEGVHCRTAGLCTLATLFERGFAHCSPPTLCKPLLEPAFQCAKSRSPLPGTARSRQPSRGVPARTKCRSPLFRALSISGNARGYGRRALKGNHGEPCGS